MRSGGLVRSGAVFTGCRTLAYLSSGDSSSTCLLVGRGLLAYSCLLYPTLDAEAEAGTMTSSPHTTESAHPSSSYYQGPSRERFELWVSYQWALEAHRPHSVAQATAGVLVPRNFFQKFGGRSACSVLRVAALSLCVRTACPPSDEEEGCLPNVLFVSGAALCPIRTRHLCPLPAPDHNPF